MKDEVQEPSGYDQRRMRSQFIWKNGVLGWGMGMAFGWSYFGANSMAEFVKRMIIGLLLYPVAGYFVGAAGWRHKQAEATAAHRAGGNKRPGGEDFFPPGEYDLIILVHLSLAGLVLLGLDYNFNVGTAADYALTALAVGGLMTAQSWLCWRFQKERSRLDPTTPNPELSLWQGPRLIWPMLLLAILAKPLGYGKVLGFVLASLIFFYPSRRRRYLRSSGKSPLK